MRFPAPRSKKEPEVYRCTENSKNMPFCPENAETMLFFFQIMLTEKDYAFQSQLSQKLCRYNWPRPSHAKKLNVDMSAVAQHTIDQEHAIHWQPRVLLKESDTTKRKEREALMIHRLGEKTMNQDKRTNLSRLWLDVVSS